MQIQGHVQCIFFNAYLSICTFCVKNIARSKIEHAWLEKAYLLTLEDIQVIFRSQAGRSTPKLCALGMTNQIISCDKVAYQQHFHGATARTPRVPIAESGWWN